MIDAATDLTNTTPENAHRRSCRNLLHMINWYLDAHGLQALNVRYEGETVSFRMQGIGGSRQCWATREHLTVGGAGRMHGALGPALVAQCYAVTTPR